jgi:DNA-binding NtrC family response regulator
MAADARLRDLLFEFLMEEGYQVNLAEHCKQAIEVMEREHGLLVVFDLLPSGSEGENLIRWLKDSQRFDHQVVALREGPPLGPERRWLATGAIKAVVHKTVNIDRLLSTLQRLTVNRA